jgi:hypothetical protein
MKVDFVKITDNTLKPDIFYMRWCRRSAQPQDFGAHALCPTISRPSGGAQLIEHLDYLIKAGSQERPSVLTCRQTLSYGEASDKFVGTFDPSMLPRNIGWRHERLCHTDAQYEPHPCLSRP